MSSKIQVSKISRQSPSLGRLCQKGSHCSKSKINDFDIYRHIFEQFRLSQLTANMPSNLQNDISERTCQPWMLVYQLLLDKLVDNRGNYCLKLMFTSHFLVLLCCCQSYFDWLHAKMLSVYVNLPVVADSKLFLRNVFTKALTAYVYRSGATACVIEKVRQSSE